MSRAFGRILGLMVVVGMHSVAYGSPGKVKKAAKLQDAYEQGDRAALVEALGVLEAAIEHPKVVEDPAAWARLGHLRFEAAKAAADPEGLSDAARDLAKALELGADGPVKSSVVGDLKAVLGTLYASAFDALEAKRYEEAGNRLASVLAVRQSLTDAGVRVDALEDKVLTLAVRVNARRGKLDDAMGFHGALINRGVFNAGISTFVARELVAAGRPDDAIAFLAELSERYPADPRLLRADVELRVETGDIEGAIARIDGQRDTLWPSVSGSFLLAEMYTTAGDPRRSEEAYRRVLEQDEKHIDALLGVAGVRTVAADAKQATLDVGDMSWKRKKALTTDIADDRTEAIALLERAWKLHPDRPDVAELLAVAHVANGDEEAALAVREAAEAAAAP